ncbi:hypothetical protein APUTEX25_001585, partial [Auxenochlorella protothecoides]
AVASVFPSPPAKRARVRRGLEAAQGDAEPPAGNTRATRGRAARSAAPAVSPARRTPEPAGEQAAQTSGLVTLSPPPQSPVTTATCPPPPSPGLLTTASTPPWMQRYAEMDPLEASTSFLTTRLQRPRSPEAATLALRPALQAVVADLAACLEGTASLGHAASLLLVGPRQSGKTLAVERALRTLCAWHNWGEGAEPSVGVVRLAGWAHAEERTAFRDTARQLCEAFDCVFKRSASVGENIEFLREMLQCISRPPANPLLAGFQGLRLLQDPGDVHGRVVLQQLHDVLPHDHEHGEAKAQQVLAAARPAREQPVPEAQAVREGELLRQHQRDPAEGKVVGGHAVAVQQVLRQLSVQRAKAVGQAGQRCLNPGGRVVQLLAEVVPAPRHQLHEAEEGVRLGAAPLLLIGSTCEGVTQEAHAEFRRFSNLRGQHVDGYTRGAALRALDALLALGVLSRAGTRANDAAAGGRQFMPLHLQVTPEELGAALAAHPSCPLALQEWFAKEGGLGDTANQMLG